MKKITLIISIPLMIFTSCKSMLLNTVLTSNGILDEKAKIEYVDFNEKKIAFMEMHHIGREVFYTDVANKVDSLQKNGYVVFYERVKSTQPADSLAMDVYRRKFRKITGITKKKYYDTINKTIAGKLKYTGQHKLMNQPDYAKLNVDIEKAKNADVELSKLVDLFETKYEKVQLNDCDLNHKIGVNEYENCKETDDDLREKFRDDFILGYRNKVVVQEIKNSTHNKILVIYGKSHIKGIKELLRK